MRITCSTCLINNVSNMQFNYLTICFFLFLPLYYEFKRTHTDTFACVS